MLDGAAGAVESANWPPYNIEKLGEDHYRITMALAGWSSEELSVVAEANVLLIEGQRRPAGERNFLHRGIVLEPFRCQFELADFVVVMSASLEHGLLTIELERQIPEAMKPRKIEIAQTAPRERQASALNGR